MSHLTRRAPISTRHALALAFDLAVRRDPFHSLVVPFLLRSPWALTLALLPPLETADDPSLVLAVASVALVGDFLTMLVLTSMLRMRARSVYNTPPGTRPQPASACYAKGMGRIPSLFLTEMVRNTLIAIAASFSILPAAAVRIRPETFFTDLSNNFLLIVVAVCLVVPTLFMGFRLAVATEAAVLDGRGMSSALIHSMKVMPGRFERWLELISITAGMVLGLALVATALATLVPGVSDTAGVAIFWTLVIAVSPVFQYAWTFFYLRLVEIEEPFQEAPPAYAGTPATEDQAATRV